MALTLTLTILLVNGETLEHERFKLLKLKNCVHLKQKKQMSRRNIPQLPTSVRSVHTNVEAVGLTLVTVAHSSA